MYLENQQYVELLTDVSSRIIKEMDAANRSGQIAAYLVKIGMEDLIPPPTNLGFENPPDGKILVMGASSIRKNVVIGIFESMGISRDRLEMYIDYEDAITYDFGSLQYNVNYSLVLVGPTPHSTKSTKGYSSFLSRIETEDGFPRVIRLGGSNLKITKSNLKDALIDALEQRDLVVG